MAVDATIFGRTRVLAGASRRKLINRRLIEPGDRSQRPRDEVQLVLDDEVRRIERPAIAQRPALAWLGRAIEADAVFEAINMPKESAGLAHPRQGGELVDGSDQKRRQAPIDRLVDGKDRQRPVAAEIAAGVGAANFEIGRRMLVRRARER